MRIMGTSLALIMGLLLAPAATAGEECCGGAPDCCARCGCHAPCQKYCRVVPATKEIKKTVFTVKCEDFCPSMPGCGCGHDHGCCGCGQEGCGGESCGGCCEQGCGCSKHCVKPDCGCPRTKKVLEKKEVTTKINCWKCEVVYACCGCGEGCCAEGFSPAAEGAAPAPMPGPAPTPAPRLDSPSPPLPPMPKRAKTTGFLPEPN